MILKKLGLVGLLAGLGLSASACADGYGYTGLGVGVGGGYADPYWDGGYGYADPYWGGGGFGGAPFGWYNNFYYPGTGAFVYDRYRRPYRWNDGQRSYWQGRQRGWRGGAIRDNWNGFRGGDRNWRGNRVSPGERARIREGGPGWSSNPGRVDRGARRPRIDPGEAARIREGGPGWSSDPGRVSGSRGGGSARATGGGRFVGARSGAPRGGGRRGR